MLIDLLQNFEYSCTNNVNKRQTTFKPLTTLLLMEISYQIEIFNRSMHRHNSFLVEQHEITIIDKI